MINKQSLPNKSRSKSLKQICRSISTFFLNDFSKKTQINPQNINFVTNSKYNESKSTFYQSKQAQESVGRIPSHRRGSIRKKRSNSAPNRLLVDFSSLNKPGETQKDYSGRHMKMCKSNIICRPLHEILHTECRQSLLSTGMKHLNLSGFVNLVFVILVAMNFRLVINNFRKYGLLMEIPKGFTQMYQDWPLLRCTLKTHISILFAWGIERYIAPLSTKPLTLPMVLLQLLNILIVLLYPYLTVISYKTEPSLSALMLITSVVWAFKMYSFHHVCFDYRKALCNGDNLLEVCKIKKEAKIASTYPNCIKLTEFYRFIIMPTVCFQVTKLSFHNFTLCICTNDRILADQYIVVAVSNTFTMDEFKSANFFTVACHIIDRMLLLSVPILYCWLLMFVVIFHFWCNFLAEITRFGDRRFYGDWWNASCFAEYWRKWNLPIHQFLIRHISKPLTNLGLPRGLINIVVFVISAALHEYLISVPLGLGWTGYVFWAMMGQIPLLLFTDMDVVCFLIHIDSSVKNKKYGENKILQIKNNKTLGNVLFWCLFCFTGQPVRIVRLRPPNSLNLIKFLLHDYYMEMRLELDHMPPVSDQKCTFDLWGIGICSFN
ncbi:acyl transferase, putative [Theileria annulata]|uniref:O-acyltransferase n=1 Tax=Theileria annulata TaxID=5874 RepID=Q4UGI8_THEAN|nr:acyl transferase, putative [Theileria annulata]CAI73801.1 acyl transferase, putative [Theileria annulata]|eukprot:XP_954478.1 acyl transferase, putative [Theileria annulata]